MLILTIATTKYVPKAVCLAKSVAKTQRDTGMVLCLVERDLSGIRAIDPGLFSRIILASEIGIPRFESFIFRHSVYEACTAIKAQFLLWALENFPEERHFVYLDPDVYVYSRFEELEAALLKNEIILTPHLLHDERSIDGLGDNLSRALMHGVFNLGFIALCRSRLCYEFLHWWNGILTQNCHADLSRGLFYDQKYLNLALSFFDILVLRDPGYNVGNWNISSRCIEKGETPGIYVVNGSPLRFFHFSGIDSDRDLYYLIKYLDPVSPVFSMRHNYVRELVEADTNGLSHARWSYDSFDSGERISPEARYSYRMVQKSFRLDEPFKKSNASLLSEFGRCTREY